MDNNKKDLNLEEMEPVSGADLLELVGGYLFDTITEKIEDLFGKPDCGKCIGPCVLLYRIPHSRQDGKAPFHTGVRPDFGTHSLPAVPDK